ncbi:MAG: biotin--[acetyl-CoA-carboxylase] ligase [Tateyamaria sp.]|nr:biotin--[acetyl-CoA-carboxylase] ligase [Tateyamaria sp.]MBT5301348.1 biotin--[acetyl-CoA-carboxylase] ligase [Tateyamaria sp.]MBT6266982.1 biotin--[acetyl-CoA-carboxylase] ligase [Tateyamaria sp.]MBT6342469.1 biotin--[acetyl-CoA-carboxylase] ligase [Tateyamaria sp.]MBT7446367.1 biotin--[acetyl-CoA-carboxylase] ligase [Tateyamaria sp.]
MTGWPTGYGFRILNKVDSTLSEAVRIIPELSGPEWILAHAQTKARGRRGRSWSMTAGNFAATLVLSLNEPPSRAALRSFVAALALRDSLVAVTGHNDAFALKWPNDVLLEGGKVAGILLESVKTGPKALSLAIGIGVNLVKAPSLEAVEAGAVLPISLKGRLGIEVKAEAFLNVLAQAYAYRETQFVTYGFPPIRVAWLAHAARLGQHIKARTAKETYYGTFADVDVDGQLVLETSKGRVTIPAGDVYF